MPRKGATATIYGLRDYRDGEIRYVGRTTRSMAIRLREHMLSEWPPRKVSWLKKTGEFIEIIEVEICPLRLANERERWWISHYTKAGCRLLNRERLSDYRRSHGDMQKLDNLLLCIERWFQSVHINGKARLAGPAIQKIIRLLAQESKFLPRASRRSTDAQIQLLPPVSCPQPLPDTPPPCPPQPARAP